MIGYDRPMLRIGIDTGGTFTDFVLARDGRVETWKEPSSPDDPARAILGGLARVAGGLMGAEIVHGSTVAANALLEGKTARIAFVTNRGFEDLLEIGRQARPDLYNLNVRRPAALAPRELRFGVDGRLDPDGGEVEPIEMSQVADLGARLKALGVEAVALCLLHCYADASHEERVAAGLARAGLRVSVSSRLVNEYREYDRASTVAVNAAVAPVVSGYLDRLGEGIRRVGSDQASSGPRLRVMGSNGGALSPRAAGEEAVRTVLSGPAAGVRAAAWLGAAIGESHLISFDMGGTSTDVALIPGAVRTSGETVVAGYPIKTPAIDIHTVGAGGGSVAWRDAGGALRVGPSSAGADPGPACYGRGGPATVTDANLVLGRILPRYFLGGAMVLDRGASRSALEDLAARLRMTVEEAAEGTLEVAEATMDRAIRVISLYRGHDPADFSLLAFGGAGGLHAASLAEALSIEKVIVPAEAGVFSAVGMMVADVLKDRSATVLRDVRRLIPGELDEILAGLEKRVAEDLAADGVERERISFDRTLDVRYRGQSYELNVPYARDTGTWIDSFHGEHQRRYGYRGSEEAVELVTARVRGIGRVDPPELRPHEVSGRGPEAREGECELFWKGERVTAGSYLRERLPSTKGDDEKGSIQGPALIVEAGATTLVPPAWSARLDTLGNIHMRKA